MQTALSMAGSHQPEIVAEIGINWQGDLDLALEMIKMAKRCGADTAKFQVYDPETTLDRNDPVIAPWWDLIMATKLTRPELAVLFAACAKEKIGFLASAFDVERVGWLEALGVERYKIASRSINDEPLIQAVLATGKPVLVSLSEKYCPYLFPPAVMTDRCKYLYCVSEYPAPLNHVKFSPNMFHIYYGFSDHTIGITSSVVAMSLGAQIIEKHFTMSKLLPGPDHTCSASPLDLRRLCRARDEIKEMFHAD